MDNKSHICLVNAHPKSHGGNNHLHKHYITLQEGNYKNSQQQQ